jgi:aromatic-L-amino-acid/L-tryptophan decarboxylase
VNERGLDPENWDDFRALLHTAVDDAVDYLATVRERPAWRPVPDAVKDALREDAPEDGEALDATYARFRDLILPYPTGNIHPRWFGWVHGTGAPVGVLAELLSATMNSNVGGREHAAVYVERAVIASFARLFGFPPDASGVLTTGTSMGNLLAVVAARDASLGPGAASAGVGGAPLTAYAAAGAHDSISKAMRIAGLGSRSMRIIPVDDNLAMDMRALRARIDADRRAGAQPFLVCATAGSVDTGAFDPLAELADLCAAERLWLHVDGAFGAFAILSSPHAHLVEGIERADSLAFDAHKWLQAPYSAGCVLFRDEAAHRAAFASAPAYLVRTQRGAAAGAPWFADYGLELSREFRALKIWFILRHYGWSRLGEMVRHCCDISALLAQRIQEASDLELLAPAPLNVVCFRVRAAGLSEARLDQLNSAIAIAVQESGEAVPSTTICQGKRALRVCIVNHRTREDDLDVLLAAVRNAARSLLSGNATDWAGNGLESTETSAQS